MKHTAMTILYELHDNLYINLTNRCPCSCTFCLRQNREDMGTSDSLWLEHEPSFEEVAAEFEKFDMDRYHEIVFCGFGEPTEALDVLLKTAHFIKEHWEKPIRRRTRPNHPHENDPSLPEEIRGKHFESWTDIARLLGYGE